MYDSVLVCGGTGFFGSHVETALYKKGYRNVIIVGSDDADLLDQGQTHRMLSKIQPSCVINLAGWNGSIAFNSAYPFSIFHDNTVMTLNLLRACYVVGSVKKIVSTVASCSYGNHTHTHTRNSRYNRAEGICFDGDFFEGSPHDSVACHGYARRNVQLATRFAKEQLGLNAVCACPPTLYGPRDNFNGQRAKFVGAMVRRYCEAVKEKKEEVQCWGSGKPLREVCYVADAATLLVEVLEHYQDHTVPLNIGTGQEVSVAELAQMVARLTGFTGKTVWDSSKPDGQRRKRLDLSRMRELLPNQPEPTPLEDGLHKTIAFYQNSANN